MDGRPERSQKKKSRGRGPGNKIRCVVSLLAVDISPITDMHDTRGNANVSKSPRENSLADSFLANFRVQFLL